MPMRTGGEASLLDVYRIGDTARQPQTLGYAVPVDVRY